MRKALGPTAGSLSFVVGLSTARLVGVDLGPAVAIGISLGLSTLLCLFVARNLTLFADPEKRILLYGLSAFVMACIAAFSIVMDDPVGQFCGMLAGMIYSGMSIYEIRRLRATRAAGD